MLFGNLPHHKKEMIDITGNDMWNDELEFLLVYDANCYIYAELDTSGEWFNYYLCLLTAEYTDTNLAKLERILFDDWYKPEIMDVLID